MRIVYIALSAKGGPGLYAQGLAQATSESHDVLYVGPDDVDADRLGSARLHRIAAGHNDFTRALRAFLPWSYASVIQSVSRFEPDVIHFSLTHPWNPILAAGLRAYPLIYTVHHPAVSHAYLYRHARAIVCLSEYSRHRVAIMADPAALVTIPLPCYSHYAALAPPSTDRSVVLCFAGSDETGGLDHFIQAAAICKPAFPGIQFVVAGPGHFHVLDHAGQALESVTVLNRSLSEFEVASLLASSVVVVLPSLTGAESPVIAAAYGAGCPVIASAVGCLPEMVRHGETGLLVPPHNPAALASAIAEMLADAEFTHRMRDAIKHFATTEGSWAHVAADHSELYTRCANQHAWGADAA